MQFHRDALQLAEWAVHEPMVERSGQSIIVHKASTVTLRVSRLPLYYLYNIVGVMLMLSVLGFTAFSLPRRDLSDRLNIVLTLLLTTVAFKFVVTDMIPKVHARVSCAHGWETNTAPEMSLDTGEPL